jgi:hypothetical protein
MASAGLKRAGLLRNILRVPQTHAVVKRHKNNLSITIAT